jgi:hypothetical protein
LEVDFIFRAVSVISDPSGGAVGRLARYSCLALTPSRVDGRYILSWPKKGVKRKFK